MTVVRVYYRWRVGILCLWALSGLAVLAVLVLLAIRTLTG
jgi:hypothetical protein